VGDYRIHRRLRFPGLPGFIEYRLPADNHLKNPAMTFDQINCDAKFLRNRSRQTGGLRVVVSLPAVGDFDFDLTLISTYFRHIYLQDYVCIT
jgi:hypothetical protein